MAKELPVLMHLICTEMTLAAIDASIKSAGTSDAFIYINEEEEAPQQQEEGATPAEAAGGPHLQPTLNVGLVGHVSHGKSTICRALSGTATQRHKSERERNCSIKLGYTNAKIWKCARAAGTAPPERAASATQCLR